MHSRANDFIYSSFTSVHYNLSATLTLKDLIGYRCSSYISILNIVKVKQPHVILCTTEVGGWEVIGDMSRILVRPREFSFRIGFVIQMLA